MSDIAVKKNALRVFIALIHVVPAFKGGKKNYFLKVMISVKVQAESV